MNTLAVFHRQNSWFAEILYFWFEWVVLFTTMKLLFWQTWWSLFSINIQGRGENYQLSVIIRCPTRRCAMKFWGAEILKSPLTKRGQAWASEESSCFCRSTASALTPQKCDCKPCVLALLLTISLLACSTTIITITIKNATELHPSTDMP